MLACGPHYDAAVNKARETQFAHIEAAKAELLAWAITTGTPLANVEFVVPFVEDDFSLDVWLFYDTDLNLVRCRDDGTTIKVEQQFKSILSAAGYPAEWITGITFQIDSHENVERNYEGSYFYRLR
jgi:hypothetical protein